MTDEYHVVCLPIKTKQLTVQEVNGDTYHIYHIGFLLQQIMHRIKSRIIIINPINFNQNVDIKEYLVHEKVTIICYMFQ